MPYTESTTSSNLFSSLSEEAKNRLRKEAAEEIEKIKKEKKDKKNWKFNEEYHSQIFIDSEIEKGDKK